MNDMVDIDERLKSLEKLPSYVYLVENGLISNILFKQLGTSYEVLRSLKITKWMISSFCKFISIEFVYLMNTIRMSHFMRSYQIIFDVDSTKQDQC